MKYLCLIPSIFFLLSRPLTTDAQRPLSIDSIVSPLLEQNKFSGTVLLAKNGTIVYQHTAGFSDASTSTPLSASSLFSIASTGKLFTAVIIEKLIEKGQLRLDQTIDQLLPDAGIPYSKEITIKQLLTHTAGMGNYMMHPRYLEMLDTIRNSETIFQLVKESSGTGTAPGREHLYSNSGYIVLGKIIERVTGLSYEEALQKFILKPAKMEGLVFRRTSPGNKNIATAHLKASDGKTWKPATSAPFPAADGGLYATAANLLHFDQAFYGNQLIPEKRRKEMLEQAVEASLPGLGKIRYGFGIMRFDYANGSFSLGHNGGFPGYGCEYRHYFLPDGTEYTLIINSNYDRSIRPLLFKIEALLTSSHF
ncbi:serine hydrolase domain-containing protein [Flavihumibacter sp. UBA7668]|uniref:serine hydrolase domain-containing protein n=1 Tax=Flavihumibacter sp. UBA7668 TaxID=1946542 RepID=UPI0025C3B3BA|nr:serine hydrolase domain-containing protein [Flavihumibacter sp. UBA7668]